MKRAIVLRAAAVTAASLFAWPSGSAEAAVFNSAAGFWSDGTKWTGGVPNAQGAVASYDTTPLGASAEVDQDVAGTVTVGTVNVTGTADFSWTVDLGANLNLTMNQDGGGAGFATISNTQSPSGDTNTAALRIIDGAAQLILADDLLVTNTSTSTRTSGSIQIGSQIVGTGNITYYNVTNNPDEGQIALHVGSSAATSSYAGTTTIAKGAVTFNRGDRFMPSPGNVVTIGRAGDGDASLYYAGTSLGNIENNFVAAAGTGGESIFGTTSAATGTVNVKTTNTNAAAFTLNGDLSFRVIGAGLLNIGDQIVGVGQVTKIGLGPMRISNTNSYQGGTVVDRGRLSVGADPATSSQFGSHAATVGTLGSGDVTVNDTAIFLQLESGVAGVNVISDTATVFLAGGGTLGVADNGYMLLDAGINETIGALILGGVFQPIGTYGSTASGATFTNDEYFSGTGILSVTLVPEPTSLALLGLGAVGMLRRRRA